MKRYLVAGTLVWSCWAAASLAEQAPPITKASPEQLRQWLRQYPEADFDRDGVLTVAEAESYRQKRVAHEAAGRGQAAPGFRHEYAWATMSDGVRIALAIGYPRGFDPADTGRKWPAIFRTCGYPGAAVPASTATAT